MYRGRVCVSGHIYGICVLGVEYERFIYMC